MQGRHPLQTSDALGAAAAHLGPYVRTLIVWWHIGLGLPFGRVQRMLRTRYGLAVVTQKVCGGNRTAHGAETQQVLASVLRTLDQRGLDRAEVFMPLLHARQAIVAPAFQAPLA